jgi:FtsP/CotA-like multicopper oxidase with cupredoxin domain
MLSRRTLLLGAGAATLAQLWSARFANASPLMVGLSDPALQPKFVEHARSALDPSFIATPFSGNAYQVMASQGRQFTGLIGANGARVGTTIWGYTQAGRDPSWPGMTFNARSDVALQVRWENKLSGPRGPLPHLLPVDRSFHYVYSLPGYRNYNINRDGVPLVPHLHGGHTQSGFDGFPEAFFSPDWRIRGPSWSTPTYQYENTQSAGHLWYHDHALGLTRLNV